MGSGDVGERIAEVARGERQLDEPGVVLPRAAEVARQQAGAAGRVGLDEQDRAWPQQRQPERRRGDAGGAGSGGEGDDSHQRSRESRTRAMLPVAIRVASTAASAFGDEQVDDGLPGLVGGVDADDRGVVGERRAGREVVALGRG